MTVTEKKLKQVMTDNNFIGHLQNSKLTYETKVDVGMVREFVKIIYDWVEIKNRIKEAEPNFQIDMYETYKQYFPTYELMKQMVELVEQN